MVLEQYVKQSFVKLGVKEGDRVGVAVSGGVDSMTLLFCLCKLRSEMGIFITAYHMEHGIREESPDDMRFVIEQCGKLGVPCVTECADVPRLAEEQGVSVETAARVARYAFLDAQAADYIATAHQMDDMAETVLLNLLRGSGLNGLCGIPERRGKYIRPLLGVSRKEIEVYAKQRGIAYVHDRTNDDTDYTRNYIRSEIIPRLSRVNRNAAANIARAAALLSADENTLEEIARRTECVEKTAEGVSVDLQKLAEQPEAVQKRVIRQALEAYCGLTDVESVHVASLMNLVQKGKSGKHVDLMRGACAAVVYGKLMIGNIREKRYNIRSEMALETGSFEGFWFECGPYTGQPVFGGGMEYFDAGAVAGAILRHRREGDYIVPLGMTEKKRLSDYLSDRKVPLHQRDALVLLAKGGEVFWVVGVGVSETSKVNKNSVILKVRVGEK